ncbi:MAG TPA: hypothetical protein VN783_08875 [Thermoanaerobaculia bacterium]|nr:hypothetical protein [Thermoanaerobaculia bacterium]
MGITVAFAGLMLICVTEDGKFCPTAEAGKNTAWVIKAYDDKGNDTANTPCGWPGDKDNMTTTYVRYTDDYGNNINYPLNPGKYYLNVYNSSFSRNKIQESINNLPRLHDIDSKFIKIMTPLNPEYLLTTINFPYTVIEADRVFPLEIDSTKPRIWWFPSNGVVPPTHPRYLSDQFLARYKDAMTISVVDYKNNYPVVTVTTQKPDLLLTIINEAKSLTAEKKGTYRDLPYLLWYNRLGLWDTRTGECPEYDVDAYLLRCKGADCHQPGAKVTTFWPVMRP